MNRSPRCKKSENYHVMNNGRNYLRHYRASRAILGRPPRPIGYFWKLCCGSCARDSPWRDLPAELGNVRRRSFHPGAIVWCSEVMIDICIRSAMWSSVFLIGSSNSEESQLVMKSWRVTTCRFSIWFVLILGKQCNESRCQGRMISLTAIG